MAKIQSGTYYRNTNIGNDLEFSIGDRVCSVISSSKMMQSRIPTQLGRTMCNHQVVKIMSHTAKTRKLKTTGSVHPSESGTIAAFQEEKGESQLDKKGNVFNIFNQLLTCGIDIYSPFRPLPLS